jgi:NhaP-type Na+/H+ or K+/H+ antiporter
MSVIVFILLLFAATAALRLLAGIPLPTPPLLFWDSLTTSLRDLKRNWEFDPAAMLLRQRYG